MSKTKFIFDQSIHLGEIENFFHYLWGYLLPAYEYMHSSQNEEFILQDAGPVMNQLAITFFQKTKYNVLIDNTHSIPNTEVLLKRLDIGMFHAMVYPIHKLFDRTIPYKKAHIELKKRIKYSLSNNRKSRSTYYHRLQTVRNLVLEQLDHVTDHKQTLVFERAKQPQFYNQKLASGKLGYGKNVRDLIHVDEFVEKYQYEYSLRAYMPGKHSIWDQIKTIHGAKGIIMIRGAEIALLPWLKKGSFVRVIKTTGSELPTRHIYTLCEAFDLNCKEFNSKEAKFPNILKYDIKNLIPNDLPTH